MGYDKEIKEVSFKLYKGRKLGIIGSNGTGKSTLLKTIVGEINSLGGNIDFGHNVEIGYFDQQMALLNSEKTIFDEFYDEFPHLTVTEVRNSLAAFMFYGEEVFKTISMLSGGEKVRLTLSKILKKGPNLLILDEPTNHMDIVGKESLENMLKEYTGTIIFVSHDRFFVNKIADSILCFDGNEAKYYDYGYEYYLEKRDVEAEKVIEEKEVKQKKTYINPLKEKEKVEKKIAKLEDKIMIKEEEKENLQKELLREEIYTDYVKVGDINAQISQIDEEIENIMLEWEELNTELENIKNCL